MYEFIGNAGPSVMETANEHATHNMKPIFQSYGVRVVLGLLLSSALAALIFQILSEILTMNWQGEVGMTTDFSLRTFVGIWIFEAFLVFIIALCIGMPFLWLSQRLRVANVVTASGIGLMLGLIVSVFYGGADIRSPDSIFFAMTVFGLPGLIGGLTFWATINGGRKIEVQNPPNS